MRPLVDGQMRPLPEVFRTLTALVRPLAAVHPLVAFEGGETRKTLVAFLALVWFHARVNAHMLFEIARTSKNLRAYVAFVRFLTSMESLVHG